MERATLVWDWLSQVMDPEIPVVSITDLGMIRSVHWDGDPEHACVIGMSPTYSGCPATDVIQAEIVTALQAQGLRKVRVELQLAPPWTTDWISEAGRQKLRAYGIAPPAGPASPACALATVQVAQWRRRQDASPLVLCPRCNSRDTERISAHGSTPCKALYRCRACKEPFDYFKCH